MTLRHIAGCPMLRLNIYSERTAQAICLQYLDPDKKGLVLAMNKAPKLQCILKVKEELSLVLNFNMVVF